MKDLAKRIYKKYHEGGKVKKYQSDLLKEVEGMGPEGKSYLKDKLEGKEYKGELKDEYKHDLDKELEGMSEEGKSELKHLLGVDEDPWKDVKEELDGKKKDKRSIGELMAHSEEGYKKGGEANVEYYDDPEGFRAAKGLDVRGEFRKRKGYKKEDPRLKMDKSIRNLPFRVLGKDVKKWIPGYAGEEIEGGYSSLRESESKGGKGEGSSRQVSKSTLKTREPVFRYKQRRDPKTNKVEKYIEAEQDKPWHEGGKFPKSRNIRISGSAARKGEEGYLEIPEASKFRDKKRAESLSKLTPYEKLEGEGMTHTRKSPEFKSELHSSPRDFKDMPKESRKGLRKMSGYGDAGDLELRHFGEAFSKADEEGKAKLAKANPGLAKELGFKEGGEAKKDWIQGAVKKPGALRAIAEKEKLIKGDEKLSGKDLNKLASQAKKKKNKLLAKRVALAKTFAKMRK